MFLGTLTRPGALATLIVGLVIGAANGVIAQNQTPDVPTNTPPVTPSPELPTDEPVISPSPTEAIPLGQPCNQPYVVAIPSSSTSVLSRVQAIAPSAFITRSHLGNYIHAGSAARRSEANAISDQFHRQGFDARVIYRPIACQATPSPSPAASPVSPPSF
jgi:hypothetical protein